MQWRIVARSGATRLACFVYLACVVGTAAAGCSSSSSAGPQLPGCPIDASIATFTFPDAALGDAGGSALSCGACLNVSCATDVQACDNDCSCLTTTKNVLECGQDGGTAYSCTTTYASSNSNFSSLALCILESCLNPCNLHGVVDAGVVAPPAEAGSAPDAAGASDATTSDAATADAATSDGAAPDASASSDATAE